MKLETIRNFVNKSLHNPTTHHARIINGLLVFLIIFSVAVIPLHFLLPNSPEWNQYKEVLFFFDRVTVTIFTIEYILRIWSGRKPMKYITSWWGIIDLMAILPFYLAKFSLIASPEIFLMLRILRILKFNRMYGMEEAARQHSQKGHHGTFKILPGEKVERVIQKHPVIFFIGMFMPLFFMSLGLLAMILLEMSSFGIALGILCFVFGAVFFIKAWLDYNYDVVYITNYRIIVQNRELFGAYVNDIIYESITNVVPDNTGLIRWLIGMGDIHIETAAMDGTLFFQNAPRPHKVVQHITSNRQRVHVAREAREVRESEIMQEMKRQKSNIQKDESEIKEIQKQMQQSKRSPSDDSNREES
ncbi:ion transporter [Candidatus Gracilibacteria bacterium]|nr:ion transporter [Candidatus Gracilibacteria bacterium]MCF7819792.1 ion transporter [Candidatus Gracilibacteria bacterium]